HEVVHQELRAPLEQVCQRRAPLGGLEAIVLLDPDPGELLPPPGQLVAPTRQLFLGGEQLAPGRKPLLARSCLVVRHLSSLLCVARSGGSPRARRRLRRPGRRSPAPAGRRSTPSAVAASGRERAAR